MVSRVEIFLGLAIAFFASQKIYTGVVSDVEVFPEKKKVLELSAATLYEVNQTHLQDIVMTDHMIVYPDHTQFKGLDFRTDSLKLIAQEAVLRGDVIVLDQNTTIIKSDGTVYHAKSVHYDKQQRVLVLPEYFRMKSQRGEVNGAVLEYQSAHGLLRGEKVEASYEMK